MLPDLKKDADGGLIIYLQSTSPGADLKANWIPQAIPGIRNQVFSETALLFHDG
jgi:hypothetical protein